MDMRQLYETHQWVCCFLREWSLFMEADNANRARINLSVHKEIEVGKGSVQVLLVQYPVPKWTLTWFRNQSISVLFLNIQHNVDSATVKPGIVVAESFQGWNRPFPAYLVKFWTVVNPLLPYIWVHLLPRFALISGGLKNPCKKAEMAEKAEKTLPVKHVQSFPEMQCFLDLYWRPSVHRATMTGIFNSS